ncbi:hypothetical protein V1525DRAFT_436094, partial [Lipomyces kononenkoae]
MGGSGREVHSPTREIQAEATAAGYEEQEADESVVEDDESVDDDEKSWDSSVGNLLARDPSFIWANSGEHIKPIDQRSQDPRHQKPNAQVLGLGPGGRCRQNVNSRPLLTQNIDNMFGKILPDEFPYLALYSPSNMAKNRATVGTSSTASSAKAVGCPDDCLISWPCCTIRDAVTGPRAECLAAPFSPSTCGAGTLGGQAPAHGDEVPPDVQLLQPGGGSRGGVGEACPYLQ